MPTLYTVIRRPLITEKGLGVKETEGTLVFDVAPEASKTEVKQAVEALFKVKVAGVRTANVVGKERRRGKFAGYKPARPLLTESPRTTPTTRPTGFGSLPKCAMRLRRA